jgi:CYTH domain-containing protein
MPIEHEHKYIIEKLPGYIDSQYEIEQFYFSQDRDRHLVSRCRKSKRHIYNTGNTITNCTITHKIGKGERVHEVEYQVHESVVEELNSFFKIGNTLHKIRYNVEIDSLKWEIDQYKNGLLVAELENPPENYNIPESFGTYVDVTNEKKYKNWYMAFNQVPEKSL